MYITLWFLYLHQWNINSQSVSAPWNCTNAAASKSRWCRNPAMHLDSRWREGKTGFTLVKQSPSSVFNSLQTLFNSKFQNTRISFDSITEKATAFAYRANLQKKMQQFHHKVLDTLKRNCPGSLTWIMTWPTILKELNHYMHDGCVFHVSHIWKAGTQCCSAHPNWATL